jgi:glycosyltransferase involved in cell wall biosynthesis
MGQFAPMPPDPWLLVLCHEFPPFGGGCGRNLRQLCLELAKQGLRLEVWTAGIPENYEEPFPVRRFDTGRKAVFETSGSRLLRYARFAWRAGKNLSVPPTALLSAMGFPAGGVGVLLNRRWGIPHYVWYHGTDAHGGKARGPGFLLKAYLRWLFRRTTGSFFVSRDLRTLAEKAGPSPRPCILPSMPAPEIRDYAGSEKPAYFLWAGRLEPVKRPQLLVEALRLMARDSLPPLRLAGEGVLEAEVVRGLNSLEASPAPRLEPPIAAEKMPGVLQGAIAILLTSRVEGFSTLLLEAAALGVPAIACDAPGLREFIRDGENGILVPDGNAVALAGAMARLWGDPALRDKLGRAARRDAENFTPAANARTLLAALAEDGMLLPERTGAA